MNFTQGLDNILKGCLLAVHAFTQMRQTEGRREDSVLISCCSVTVWMLWRDPSTCLSNTHAVGTDGFLINRSRLFTGVMLTCVRGKTHLETQLNAFLNVPASLH